MTENKIHREITPLTEGDCFLVFNRKKDNFDFPIHFHPEYELNCIIRADGAKRIVGDHIGEINDYELLLIGPNLYHGWEQHDCTMDGVYEITIQFHRDLFHDSILKRNIMQPIRDLLDLSVRGISFSTQTTKQFLPRLENLAMKNGIDSYFELFSILYDLSYSRNQQILSTIQVPYEDFQNSKKIKQVCDYIEAHFHEKIKLEDVARHINMTIISFSRLIKNRTGKTFIEFLNDYRIGYATRMLIEGNNNIAEIAYECGFNNLANFNRTFKKKKNCSPTVFRNNFAGIKRIN